MNNKLLPKMVVAPGSGGASHVVVDKNFHALGGHYVSRMSMDRPFERNFGIIDKKEMHEGAKCCRVGLALMWVDFAHSFLNFSDGECFSHD